MGFFKNKGKIDPGAIMQDMALNIKTCFWFLNIVLLIIHCLLEVIYVFSGVRVMIVENIFVIAFYAVMFFFLRNNKLKIYCVLMYIEILSHSVLGSLCLGNSCGFQRWAITLMCACFLPMYALFDVSELKRSSTLITSSVGLVYIVLCVLHLLELIPDTIPGVAPIIVKLLSLFNSLVLAVGVFFFTYLFTSRITSIEKKYRYQARHDQLTGLYNRFALNEIISKEMSAINKDKGFSIAIADIDFFKRVNDTYGHETGDSVLYIVSENLIAHTNDTCKVGRWGGEEFLFIVFGENSDTRIREKMESIRNDIEHLKIPYKDSYINITISAGISTYISGDNKDTILQRADDNLYEAKETGRNKVVF